jgi:PAS domain-containing protein
MYANFLNDKQSDRALQYYQRSLLTYLEHMHYRDVYANSSDAMFVLQVWKGYGFIQLVYSEPDQFLVLCTRWYNQPNGKILDCNGAAMTLFHARSRNDLCHHTNFVDLVHGNKDKLRIRKMLVALDKGQLRNERINMSMDVKRRRSVINVAMCASRVQVRLDCFGQLEASF